MSKSFINQYEEKTKLESVHKIKYFKTEKNRVETIYEKIPRSIANNEFPETDYDVCQLSPLEFDNLHTDHLQEKKCRLPKNYGYFDRDTHKWQLHQSIKETFNQIMCYYRNITRIDDGKFSASSFVALKEYDVVRHDVVEVKCEGLIRPEAKKYYPHDVKSLKFESLYPQIIKNLHNQVKKDENNEKCIPMNIILMSYDSVSRVSWINRLKKSYAYVKETMKFEVLEGYNIVGDGTPAGNFIQYYATLFNEFFNKFSFL